MSFIYDDFKKYNELLKVSDPKKVVYNAIKYFNDPNIIIYLSTNSKKKYMILDDKGHQINFGDINAEDFTKHNNLIRRYNYLKRATNIKGNWRNNKYSPNLLSINLTWM